MFSEKNPVRALREAAGVSPDDFALMAGVGRSTLNGLEAGRYTDIPERWASAILSLGASYAELCAEYKAWRACRQIDAFERAAARTAARLTD